MTRKVYHPNEILITDTNGKTFMVSPLSFSDRERFRSYLGELMDMIKQEEDQKQDFIDLYDNNMRINTICRLIFDLHSIPIDQVSTDMFFNLLFPAEDQDMGILAQVNALKPASIDRDSNTEVKDAYHHLLAQLFELTGSLNEAIDGFTRVPAATLLSTMEALAEIRKATDPEAKKEDLKQRAHDKIMELQKKREQESQ